MPNGSTESSLCGLHEAGNHRPETEVEHGSSLEKTNVAVEADGVLLEPLEVIT